MFHQPCGKLVNYNTLKVLTVHVLPKYGKYWFRLDRYFPCFGSTLTILYFYLDFNIAYAAHYIIVIYVILILTTVY